MWRPAVPRLRGASVLADLLSAEATERRVGVDVSIQPFDVLLHHMAHVMACADQVAVQCPHSTRLAQLI